MVRFEHLTIRTKIIILALSGLIGFFIYFLTTVYVSTKISDNIEHVKNQEYPTILLINSIQKSLNQVRNIVAEAVSQEDADSLSEINHHVDKIRFGLEKIKDLSPTLLDDIVFLERTFTQYYSSINIAAQSVLNGQKIEDILNILRESQHNYDSFYERLVSLGKSQENQLTKELEQSKNQIKNFQIYGMIVGAAIFFILFFLMHKISTQINQKITYAISIANKIAEQQFDIDIQHNNKNEIGLLLTAINRMRNELWSNSRWQKATTRFINVLDNTDMSMAIHNASNEIFIELNLLGLALYTSSDATVLKPECIISHAQENIESRSLMNDDFAHKVFQTQKVKQISGPFNEQTFSISISIGKLKPKIIIGWPVLSGNECVGVIVMFSNHIISEEEKIYLDNISARLGGRITSAKLEKSHLKLIKNLKIANEESLLASKAKSDFLAMMSHEIRTPMNGVIGMTSLLQKTKLTNKQQHYCDTSLKSAQSLLTIINDILDFSKIEAGKMELELLPFDLRSVAEDVIEIISMRNRDKNIEFLLHYKQETQRFVIGDPDRVRQILLNLLSNAIKFTEKGFILTTVEVTHVENKLMTFQISVQDTGIGIPQDKISTIFHNFNQGDGSTTRKYGGTGLGLAITQQLCQMMDGDIWLNSTLGQGSTFRFDIKLSESKQEIKPSTVGEFEFLRGLKCLIIDNTTTARMILEEQLSELELNIHQVSSATSGLQKLTQGVSENKPFQIVITDHHMPEMNGDIFTREIRKNNLLDKGALIFVSSSLHHDGISHLKDLGVDGYLMKPIRYVEITQALSIIWNAKQAGKNIPLVTKDTIQHKPVKKHHQFKLKDTNILLVEDNPTNQMVATEMLEAIGCSITSAGNGLEAVNIIHNESFDLIFMDCQMPEMDGFEATKKIREHEEKMITPRNIIIAFTANAIMGDKEKTLNAGMDDYISKPVSDQSLQNILMKWLPDKLINPEENTEPPLDTEKCIINHNEEPILDLIPFNKLKILFKEKFTKAIETNITTIEKNVKKAQDALENRNFDALTISMHSLKSSSRQFGAMRLGDIAEKIESHSQKKEWDCIEDLLCELQSIRDETIDYYMKETQDQIPQPDQELTHH